MVYCYLNSKQKRRFIILTFFLQLFYCVTKLDFHAFLFGHTLSYLLKKKKIIKYHVQEKVNLCYL